MIPTCCGDPGQCPGPRGENSVGHIHNTADDNIVLVLRSRI